MQVTIGGEDITDRIPYESFRIDNILTQQVDRCTFKIRNLKSDIYRPHVGEEVIVLDDDGVTKIFGGVITRRTDSSPAFGLVEYNVDCSDYTRLLDQKLVADTYEDMTVGEIIDDLITNYAPTGFTTTQVDCDITVSYVQFKYEPVSACLKQLADRVGYDWYVDYDMDLYFQSPSANDAPFEITDTNGNADQASLVIRRDNSQLRTSIIVRGGEYLGTQFTASAKADGKDVTFKLPYKYSDFKIRKNGVTQTLGIDYIDDPLSFDALYNFQEKVVRWRSDNKPAADSTLSFSGKPHLPVIIKFKDPVAVAAIFSAEGFGDGEYEYVIIDKSINNQVSARERAAAEINTYGETLSEGEFETETAGLTAGMRIHITSVARNIDEYFIVNKVTVWMPRPDAMKYRVSLVTTKTMDYISILKKLILRDNKTIDLNADEQLDVIESMVETLTLSDMLSTFTSHNPQAETITMTETFTAQSENWPVVWALGPQAPSGFKRQFILDGSFLSN